MFLTYKIFLLNPIVHMMRTCCLLLLICFPVFLTSSAKAQDQPQSPSPTFAVFAGGGVSNPFGPDTFNDSWKLGYNMNGGFGVRINNRMMIRPMVSYSTFGLDTAALPDDLAVPEEAREQGQFSTLTVMADLLVELQYNPFVIEPYFIIGTGYFKGSQSGLNGLQEEVDLGTSGADRAVLGLNGGVGVRSRLTNFLTAFAEGKAVVGFTGEFGIMYAPLSAGLIVLF